MLAGIPQVTKNLLLLNVLMFILTFVFESKGIVLGDLLGAHYFGTPLFEPYQIVSHFFMHDGIFHLFFNMYALVIFGSFLEKLWGPKRFFILYVASALGAFLLYNGMGYFQILELKAQINNESLIAGLNGIIKENHLSPHTIDLLNEFINSHNYNAVNSDVVSEYVYKSYVPMVGASGAIFGILASFAILFPNTELQLLFPPIPIKAKWLIGGYFILEVYMSFQDKAGDNVAHLAHVGGAIVGAIIVLIWRKRSNHFY
jgi:membrane associated rhomboid family serine protease